MESLLPRRQGRENNVWRFQLVRRRLRIENGQRTRAAGIVGAAGTFARTRSLPRLSHALGDGGNRWTAVLGRLFRASVGDTPKLSVSDEGRRGCAAPFGRARGEYCRGHRARVPG